MSRLTDLLRQVRGTDAQLGADLEKEFSALTKRRSFGLVFERHQPEAVELPGQPIRRGAKVRVLQPRGETSKGDSRLWRVDSIESDLTGKQIAQLVELVKEAPERTTAPVEDLVVVAEFEDKIYPGLVETGRVERGGDKPFHTVINAENFHALEMLTYTHRGMVDLIYIDPPYNTGNEWIYNDKYVASSDDYRHSKWLAFMERRLLQASTLLSTTGALCISIGSDEVHRLKLLVEQTFPQLTVQVITVQVTAGGKATAGVNTLNEYLICATNEDFLPGPTSFTGGVARTPWEGLVLAGFDRTQRPNQAYPIFVDAESGAVHSVGRSLAAQQRDGSYVGTTEDFSFEVTPPAGTVALWPITLKGEERVWRLAPDRFEGDWAKGYIKVSPNRRKGERNLFSVQYLPAGVISKVENGEIQILGYEEGVPTLQLGENRTVGAALPSIWTEGGFRTSVGTDHLKFVLGDKRFPYPKPVPLIADIVRGFAPNKEDAVILDYFGGSGTLLEAVMAANDGDGGSRQAVLITNNEVSADDSSKLRAAGHRKGELIWESKGVFEYVARPRIKTVVSGMRPDGTKISDGFNENVNFLNLTYESPLSVRHNRVFERIAPMLWLRAGSEGRIINDLGARGWDVSSNYGVLENVDNANAFLDEILGVKTIRIAFVITDDDAAFQMIYRELPSTLETVQLYKSYLQNFEINQGRGF